MLGISPGLKLASYSLYWHTSPAPTTAVFKPVSLLFDLWDRLSHCQGWPQTHHADKEALKFWSSYPHLPSSGVTGVWHHSQLLGITPRAFRVLGRHSVNWATLPAQTWIFKSYLARYKLMATSLSFYVFWGMVMRYLLGASHRTFCLDELKRWRVIFLLMYQLCKHSLSSLPLPSASFLHSF